MTDLPDLATPVVTWDGLSPPYGTIVADPPWDLSVVNAGWADGDRDPPYSLMTGEAVKDLEVADLAARSCHLYMWTVTSVLRHSFGVVESWGFQPKQVLVWMKPGFGTGGRFRQNVEYVIFGTRGPNTPILRRDVPTGNCWPRGPHSEKPAAFYDLVESVSPGPYVDLFARRQRLGWDSWGHGHEIGESA